MTMVFQISVTPVGVLLSPLLNLSWVLIVLPLSLALCVVILGFILIPEMMIQKM